MHSLNPFQPPATESFLKEPELPRIFVDGPNLVISSGIELPRRCIKTNQPVSERNAVRQNLLWRGRTFQLTMSGKECAIVWYATSWIIWKSRVGKIAEILIWPAFICGIAFDPGGAIWPRFLLGTAIIMLPLIVILKQPLRVVDWKKNRFWIKGCCPEFLESLQ